MCGNVLLVTRLAAEGWKAPPFELGECSHLVPRVAVGASEPMLIPDPSTQNPLVHPDVLKVPIAAWARAVLIPVLISGGPSDRKVTASIWGDSLDCPLAASASPLLRFCPLFK